MNENLKLNELKLIALCGVAQSGKDSFCQLAISVLNEYGIQAKRFALADKLKQDIDPFFREKLNMSAFTSDLSEKSLIRPLLVEYGRVKRISTQGTYWTRSIEKEVKFELSKGVVPIITDCRYAEYPEDELWWVTKKMKGSLIHISRYTGDESSQVIQAPNIDEEKNDPMLKYSADVNYCWRSLKKDEPLSIFSNEIKQVLKRCNILK